MLPRRAPRTCDPRWRLSCRTARVLRTTDDTYDFCAAMKRVQQAVAALQQRHDSLTEQLGAAEESAEEACDRREMYQMMETRLTALREADQVLVIGHLALPQETRERLERRTSRTRNHEL